jgi:hypothetical protein
LFFRSRRSRIVPSIRCEIDGGYRLSLEPPTAVVCSGRRASRLVVAVRMDGRRTPTGYRRTGMRRLRAVISALDCLRMTWDSKGGRSAGDSVVRDEAGAVPAHDQRSGGCDGRLGVARATSRASPPRPGLKRRRSLHALLSARECQPESLHGKRASAPPTPRGSGSCGRATCVSAKTGTRHGTARRRTNAREDPANRAVIFTTARLRSRSDKTTNHLTGAATGLLRAREQHRERWSLQPPVARTRARSAQAPLGLHDRRLGAPSALSKVPVLSSNADDGAQRDTNDGALGKVPARRQFRGRRRGAKMAIMEPRTAPALDVVRRHLPTGASDAAYVRRPATGR